MSEEELTNVNKKKKKNAQCMLFRNVMHTLQRVCYLLSKDPEAMWVEMETVTATQVHL